jgi:hypothetical protein
MIFVIEEKSVMAFEIEPIVSCFFMLLAISIEELGRLK